MKKIFIVGLVVLAFCAGIWLSNLHLIPRFEKHAEEDASMLLDKIDQVAKLITVEGYISEVYDYKDYYGYDWSLFRKKALIRIKAKISAGYDLSNLKIEADATQKIISIHQLPAVEILSIDHDLDYYDLQEGTFNSFSEKDLNQLNRQAKDYIKQIARDSEIIKQAQTQANDMIEMIRFVVEGSGWQLEMSASEKVRLPG